MGQEAVEFIFLSYKLSSDDRIEDWQGGPLLISGDELKPAPFSIAAVCLFVFSNPWKNSPFYFVEDKKHCLYCLLRYLSSALSNAN